MSSKEVLIRQLIKDIEELIRAYTSEENLEKSVTKKLSEKFSELIIHSVEVKKSER